MVGAFSHRCSIAPSGETTDLIEKLGSVKMARTSSITMPGIVGIIGHPGFSLRGKFIQKLPFLAILGAVSAHF